VYCPQREDKTRRLATLFDMISPGNECSGAGRMTPSDELRLRRVVASLMEIQTDARNSKFLIQLKEFQDRTFQWPERQQTVLMSDDKKSLKAVLSGGQSLVADDLRASLQFSLNKETVTLLPISLDVDTKGRAITVTFPSLTGNQLASASASPDNPKKPVEHDPADMKLNLWNVDLTTPSLRSPVIYSHLRLVKGEPEQPGNPVSVMSRVLVADATSTAKVTLLVDKWESTNQEVLAIQVSGADIRAVDPPAPINAVLKAVPLSPKSVVTLTLGNVTPMQTIQLQTLANKDDIKKPLGMPITLSVLPQLQTGK
jgi:hypothetical protein